MAKWTIKKAIALTALDRAKMTLPERAELASFLYSQLKLREATFLKAMTIPFAYTKLLRDFEDIRNSEVIPADRRKMNLDESPAHVRKGKVYLNGAFAEMERPDYALASYNRNLINFFKAKSSTVKGWREIGEEQDIRLFGSTTTIKRGRMHKGYQEISYIVTPNYRMTDVERTNFWSVYDEAERAGWMNQYGYDSNQSHRAFASLWESGKFSLMDIEEANAKIKAILDNRIESYPEHAAGDDSDFFQQRDESDINYDAFA